MNINQFTNGAAGPAPSLPADLDPADDKAVDAYIVNLLQRASAVEAEMNQDTGSRENRYGWRVDENGTFRGTANIPVEVGSLTVK